MLDDPSLRKGVLAGILASILFFVLIQPVLTYGAAAFLWAADVVPKRISDIIYRNAARGLKDFIPVMAFGGLGGAVIGACVATVFVMFSKHREPKTEPSRRPLPYCLGGHPKPAIDGHLKTGHRK